MPWSILYIKDNLEWSLHSSNGFQPRNSNIEERLPLEYCVGDGEVMTLAVSDYLSISDDSSHLM